MEMKMKPVLGKERQECLPSSEKTLRLVHAVTADGMREKTEVEREVREGTQGDRGLNGNQAMCERRDPRGRAAANSCNQDSVLFFNRESSVDPVRLTGR